MGLELTLPSHWACSLFPGFSSVGWLSSWLPSMGTPPDLRDCLAHFCAQETLDGDNQYYCAACKKNVDAT